MKLKEGKAYLAVSNRDVAPSFVKDFDADEVLRDGDILMPQAGHLPAWVHEDDGQTWVASSRLTVLRQVDDGYDPYFIAACLNAPENIDDHGPIGRRKPWGRITIPELDRDQQQVIGDTQRALDAARKAARQVAHQAEEASAALVKLVFAGK